MSPEEERDLLEEMAVAGCSLAIHIADDEEVRGDLQQLAPFTQQMIHGVVTASMLLRAQEPPAWIQAAARRLTMRFRLQIEALALEELEKRGGSHG